MYKSGIPHIFCKLMLLFLCSVLKFSSGYERPIWAFYERKKTSDAGHATGVMKVGGASEILCKQMCEERGFVMI